LRENPLDDTDITNLAALFGGTGMNRYEYVQNAPVEINGGPGIGHDRRHRHADRRFLRRHRPLHRGRRSRRQLHRHRAHRDQTARAAPDRIWILSTSPSIETVVDGGTGDDEIHIGGTPPLLVFDPPAVSSNTPPAFEVQLPPVITYTDATLHLSGFTFTASFGDWLSAGGDPFFPSTTPNAGIVLAQRIAARIATLRLLFDPLSTYSGADVSGAHILTRFSFLPFLFTTNIQVSVDTFDLHFQVGHIDFPTKLVQPPTITVDPPAFAFQAPGRHEPDRGRRPPDDPGRRLAGAERRPCDRPQRGAHRPDERQPCRRSSSRASSRFGRDALDHPIYGAGSRLVERRPRSSRRRLSYVA